MPKTLITAVPTAEKLVVRSGDIDKFSPTSWNKAKRAYLGRSWIYTVG